MTDSGYAYRVSMGESFDSIALAVYGDEKYAAELMCRNSSYIGTLIFSGGEELILPQVDTTEEQAANAPWKEG